jgi:peptide-methionine (S)-S-oxide reductase
MRQGNDIGTQYRSVIYALDNSDLSLANKMKNIYQSQLDNNNLNKITTEIDILKNFFIAEEYHQQYLAKNPNGYCGIGGTGCTFPK